MRLHTTALSLGLAAIMTTGAAIAQPRHTDSRSGTRHVARSAERHHVPNRNEPAPAPVAEACDTLACPQYLLIGVGF
jgi:hypothetical protein